MSAVPAPALRGEAASPSAAMGEAMSTRESEEAAVLLVRAEEGWEHLEEDAASKEYVDVAALCADAWIAWDGWALGLPLSTAAALPVTVPPAAGTAGPLGKAEAE